MTDPTLDSGKKPATQSLNVLQNNSQTAKCGAKYLFMSKTVMDYENVTIPASFVIGCDQVTYVVDLVNQDGPQVMCFHLFPSAN